MATNRKTAAFLPAKARDHKRRFDSRKSIVAEEKSLDSRSVVAEPPKKVDMKKTETGATYRGYTDKQRKNYREWLGKQAQISIKIPQNFKKELDDHVQARGESLRAFVIRALQEQIERDTTTESMDLDKMLSE